MSQRTQTSPSARSNATFDDPRWAAVVTRDPRADGQFFYAVKTTGIFCRPTCCARTPKPLNVAFYATQDAAEQAGFRPCKRCRPGQPTLDEQRAVLVTSLCRYIEQSEVMPSLDDLAQRAQMSPHHLHRIFKAITGVTPRAYATATRSRRVRNALSHNDTITEAIYAAGYNANGRFYEESDRLLGMTPKHYRNGGAHTSIRFAVGECALGAVLVASSTRGICAITLGDDPDALVRDLQDRFPRAELVGGDTEFEQWIAQVIGFIETPEQGLNLPLDVQGTAFQQRVWHALQEIPVGTTASYTEIAERIGAPRSVRAVAGACAANTLAVAIPCHRVVRNDGGLSGYRWGVERKRALIEREAAATAVS
ncbi:MAG: bifunctional DNA-binding transcriptional regulator/O6-methylguanine-DNA methyltransferase Ada [Halothiobacillus sp.]|jgi:AraC family transcriptional regulator of adaptative response/methylated-DNA-[protein]-cysteine methyltransferase|nr:bifunctional DNA-binding transcriptional regulator/O6-methylguanine-DNA methyltransferase Ada [Halothiobacillus sp.]